MAVEETVEVEVEDPDAAADTDDEDDDVDGGAPSQTRTFTKSYLLCLPYMGRGSDRGQPSTIGWEYEHQRTRASVDSQNRLLRSVAVAAFPERCIGRPNLGCQQQKRREG